MTLKKDFRMANMVDNGLTILEKYEKIADEFAIGFFEWCVSQEALDNITFRVDKNSVYLKTIFTPNSWVTENVFTFVDKNTLKCVITGENLEGETIITYKKVK